MTSAKEPLFQTIKIAAYVPCFTPPTGCLSVHLHAEAVLSTTVATAPLKLNVNAKAFSILTCELVLLCQAII